MLAPLNLQSNEVETSRQYSGFPWWHAMLVQPSREQRSAEWLKQFGMYAYLPTFTKQCKRGRGSRVQFARLCACIPGMIFIPVEMLDVERRDEKLEWAHVRGFIKSADGLPARIRKSDIELIRKMEAKLNLPPEAKGVLLKLGQSVRFVDSLFDVGWGSALVVEIANEGRIGVEVPGLFGRVTKTYVPASEIEAM